jgi:hypothetical protein
MAIPSSGTISLDDVRQAFFDTGHIPSDEPNFSLTTATTEGYFVDGEEWGVFPDDMVAPYAMSELYGAVPVSV